MNVYVIEDDALLNIDLQIFLENCGFNILGIGNTLQEATRFLTITEPDLIITDIMLENELVFDLYESLPLLNNIPTIFLTAYNKQDFIEKTKLIKRNIFLAKPVNYTSLETIVKTFTINNHTSTTKKETDLQTTNRGILTLFNAVQELNLLEILNVNNVEKKLLEEKWFNHKTFKQIGNEMHISNERARKKYLAAIRKLKTRLQYSSSQLHEYQEFKKVRFNKANFKKLKATGNAANIEIDNSNIHIDELIEIPTKYRNILKEKGITRIGELSNYTFKQLALFKHLGEGSAKMIEDAIAKFGVKLKN